MEKFYTLKEVSEITGYTLNTLRAYRSRGHIEGVKLGRQWRFTEAQIKDFINKKIKEGKSEKCR